MNKKLLPILILNCGLASPAKYENIFKNVQSWFTKLETKEQSADPEQSSEASGPEQTSEKNTLNETEIVSRVATVAVANNIKENEVVAKSEESKILTFDESKVQKMLVLSDNAYNLLKGLPEYKTMFLDFAKGCVQDHNKMIKETTLLPENRSQNLKQKSDLEVQVSKSFDLICSNNLLALSFEPRKLDNKFLVKHIIKNKTGSTAEQIKNRLIDNLYNNLDDKNTAEFFNEIKNVKNEQEYNKIVQKRFDSQDSKINAVKAIAKVFAK